MLIERQRSWPSSATSISTLFPTSMPNRFNWLRSETGALVTFGLAVAAVAFKEVAGAAGTAADEAAGAAAGR
ncbi:hypothetical protein [Actinoplanes derwentensis]|uniref:hypothetical protein n=1 Tax=Actinoplanes derwentensis TaxID=113562 RepID=UPI0019415667|nr:hypothetical protein [Actinoplanes derwentensis]